MYYVYEWFIVETGEIIYVGKGTRQRYKVRKHNKFFNEMICRFECESRIIKEFESEKEAFYFEKLRVDELKAIGQCVCNIYDGGLGGTTSWWTDERRQEYSEKNVMRSQAQRERMSKNNPMKNKDTAMAVGKKKTRQVIIDGKEYESVKAAEIAFNCSHGTIKKWCTKGVNPSGQQCRYKDEPQKIYQSDRYNTGTCHSVIYNGKRYESGTDAAKVAGVSPSAISHWVKKGFSPDGIECRFEDDTRHLEYKKIKSGWKNRKPIIVNGVRYESKKAAEIALGFKPGYLSPYLNGTRKNNKYICEYDNQQPSRGNSDKSTPEGSTTNG